MHEHSLLKDLIRKIETVAHENRTERVLSVRVKLGALAHISPDHFREHFTHAVVGTLAEGAKVEIETLTDISDPQAQDIILDSVELVEP